LITAKSHEQLFDTDSFVEAMSVSRKVASRLAEVGNTISYIDMADCKAAGQTVPHAHLHASFAKDVTEEVLGIAKIVRKILIDSWMQFLLPSLFQLSDRQLQPILIDRQNLLEPVLKS
jgi:hypothetical protein